MSVASTFPLAAEAALAGRQLLALAGLAASAYAAGRWLAWDLPWRGPAERVGVAVALGLAALGELGFLLGASGQLAFWPLLALLAAVHLLAWRVWREEGKDLARFLRPPPGAGKLAEAARGERRRLVLASLAAVAALAPLLALTLYPPTAFDATLYHLPFARAFARTGALPWLPDLRFPVFPQLSEVLFAGLLLLAGEVAMHLVELAAMLATALLLHAWASEAFSPAAGWLAAAAWLGNPLVVHLAGTAYIEPGLALFVTASLYALWRWRQGSGRGWLALAGAFAGAAAAVKYLGLFFLAVGALLVVARSWRLRQGGLRRFPGWRLRETAVHGAIFGAAALLVLLPWYGRIFLHTGNPVFPFLPGVFGASPWQPHRFVGVLGAQPGAALAAWESSFGSRLGQGLARLATLPWDWTFRRGEMGAQPPVSPAYLLAAPLLAWAAWRDRRLRGPLGIAVAWMVVSQALPRDSRYLLPALALLSFALAGALDRLMESLPGALGPAARQRLLAAAALALFLPGWVYAVYRLARQGPPPATAAARARYLAAALPLYPAVARLNRTAGAAGGSWRAYGLFAENMKYFVQGDLVGDWNGLLRFERVAPLLADPERLYCELRGRRIRYLLIHLTPVEKGGVRLPDTPAARRRFRLVYADRSAQVYTLR